MTIAILDFGSQYTQLIARRIRGLKVFSIILPHDTPMKELTARGVAGVILSGGPKSVLEEGAPMCDPEILQGDLPVLGICYGMQLMAHQLGGKIRTGSKREYGRALIQLDKAHPLASKFTNLNQEVWMSHGDHIAQLPQGFGAIGRSGKTPVVITNFDARKMGYQFHPEVQHTLHGRRFLEYWVSDICGCVESWTTPKFLESKIKAVKKEVGDEQVILGMSGGVDSMVTAAILREAIGDQLICVFVDNGLLRKNEREEVIRRFKEEIKTDLHVHDASKEFLAVLKGITDPEEKRRRIGHTFIEAFKTALDNLGENYNPKFLAQGTLYPDVIESNAPAGAPSDKIKTHHNVGGLPDELGFTLLEPLRWLFKDEIRTVGVQLGLSPLTISRHPYPGPGLAIRIIGEVTPEALETVREADDIFIKELLRTNAYYTTSQALAVLLPVQSVGVMGDCRTYENTIALRAVKTSDFMTAEVAPLDHDFLNRVATRIINEVPGVNRVVYDISSKPPATIEWE